MDASLNSLHPLSLGFLLGRREFGPMAQPELVQGLVAFGLSMPTAVGIFGASPYIFLPHIPVFVLNFVYLFIFYFDILFKYLDNNYYNNSITQSFIFLNMILIFCLILFILLLLEYYD